MTNSLPATVPQVPPVDLGALAATDPILAEHACEIRKLGNRVKADIIEIGRRLQDARNRLRGRFGKWCDRELGWSVSTAGRFIGVYEFSEAEEFKFVKLTDAAAAVTSLTISIALIEQLLQRLTSQRHDGLDIPACLRRAPPGTSSAASGTPPALAAGSSNGGITMRLE